MDECPTFPIKELKHDILQEYEIETKRLIYEYLRNNINYFSHKNIKEEAFSTFISFLQKLIFEGDKELIEKLKHHIEPIFWIQKSLMVFVNRMNTEVKDNFIPSDYFKLLNSLFELVKTLDSNKKANFLKEIEDLFKKSSNFILKYFNELFEILIYSKIDQNEKVKNQGENLYELLKTRLKEYNWAKDYKFDYEKFEKLILEKTKANQPILTEFLAEWMNILISLPLNKYYSGQVFYDFIPWIIKIKNSGDSDSKKIVIYEINLTNKFLEYFDYDMKEIEQIKKCILSFIKLVREQKEINQYKEFEFLNQIIIKINEPEHEKLIKEIFPFETLNNFLLLILLSKNFDDNLNELNYNLKSLIEKEKNYEFEKNEFNETIKKGINNSNFSQKIISLDWYILMNVKNKNKGEEPIKEIIKIILKTIEENMEEENNENLFLEMLKKLCKNNILFLFDLLCDYIITEKLSYNFKYKIIGYLNDFLIYSSRAPELKESLITPINKKDKNTDNDLLLFEKLYKIFSVNPMCLLIFCIYMELYELGWELILNFKNIKLEDDYYEYLAIFVQTIENRQWNDLRIKFLYPNKNIYFIKCLYGILMLLPQGKAFDILSDRLYSIKGLIKSKEHFDNYKTEKNTNNKDYIEKYVKLFEIENKNIIK